MPSLASFFQYVKFDPDILGVPGYFIDQRTQINTVQSSDGDFDTTAQAWTSRIETTYDYPTWTLGGGAYAAYSLLCNTANNINALIPEVCGIESFMFALESKSKARMYGFEAALLKNAPCVTENDMIGIDSYITSDVDPATALTGAGFRSFSADWPGGVYFGVRQHTGFWACGTRGWKYGFKYDDIDGTPLFSVDELGNVNAYGSFAAYDTVFVNYDCVADDEPAIIYFNSNFHELRWEPANSRFEISSHLYSLGNLEAAAEFYVNFDYTAGDEDASIFFNGVNECFKFDFGNDRFELTKGLYLAAGSLEIGADCALSRRAANIFNTPDRLEIDSLGVNNSVNATTPGDCQKKIEVFDCSGNSLGYIAVYDAIS